MRGVTRGRRGRPARAVRLARGAILPRNTNTSSTLSMRTRRSAGQNGSASSEEIRSASTSADKYIRLNIGDEIDRWKELKERQDLETDEDMARFLLDSWEAKETRKENHIQVGMATIRDFENFKSRTKRSSDEVIRFFLRLDIEPGQNVIPVSEEMGKMFDSLKSSLRMGANDLMKHLFDVKEKFSKKVDENKGNYLSGIEKRVRDAVREEMMQLMSDGVLKSQTSSKPALPDQKPLIGGPITPAKRESGASQDPSPDSGKKRPRKSLPQRVVVEADDTLEDSDGETSLAMSVTSMSGVDNAATGTVETPSDVQYNYVINPPPTLTPVSFTTPVTLVGNPQVSWTGVPGTIIIGQQTTGTQGLAVAGTQFIQTTAGINAHATKELEQSKGIFQVGGFKVVREANGVLNCPHCDYRGINITRLQKHFTLHTGKLHPCNQCERSYTEEYKLKEHIQVKHEKSMHFKCHLCEKEFTSKGGLKYHTKTTHRNDFAYWCEGCCKGFNYLQFYQVHMNKHSGPTRYKCNVCFKEFTYLATLSMHRKTCIGAGPLNSLTCEMCGEMYTSAKDLEEHMNTEHSDLSTYRCVCGAEFRLKAGLESHRLNCKVFLTGKKSPIKQEVDGLSNMMIVNVESLSISPSSSSFVDSTKSTNVDFDENSNDSVQITSVESGTPNFSSLGDEDDSSRKGSWTNHSCQFCDYKTQKLSHMKRHELTHTGKKYKCHDCPKSFNEIGKLRTHQNSKHQGQARYKCDKCSRTFSSKGGIMYHQQTKHNNSYKYKCETCDKGFNTIQHYLGHKNTHTGIRPFVCDKCNIGFSYPSVLTSHKRVCKGKIDGLATGGIDLYPCQECKEKFALPSSLQDHVREMHSTTLTSKYMCECGEEFELHALYELHKSRCKKSDRSSEMILQAISVEADSTENSAADNEEEFRQLVPEQFNSVVNNQPVFPT